jgi:hypothetical protein
MKKALFQIPMGPIADALHLPEGVEVVQVAVKVYGPGLPDHCETKEGEPIAWVSLEDIGVLLKK